MQPATSNSSAPPTAKFPPLPGPMNRIRRWLLRGGGYKVLEGRLGKLEAAWRREMLAQGHAIEIARSIEEKVARLERETAELATMQPRLTKLESALRQQVFLHLHAMGSSQEEITRVVETVLRRELDAGLSGNSVLADLLGGLWEDFDQLHAQVQAVAEARLAATEGKIGNLDNLPERNSEIVARLSDIEKQIAATAEVMRTAEVRLDKAVTERLAQISEELQNIAAQAARRDELEVIRSRGEFIRRELMYEFRAALHQRGRDSMALVSPKIVNTTKVVEALARDMLRLNVGCGHASLDQYVNVDRRELPGVDAIADATDLPFDDEVVAEIYSAHLLEHFPEEMLRRVVLPHWRKKLRPGGILRTVVPDAEAMIKDFFAGEMSFADLRDVTFGGQDYGGDFHFTMFSHDHLTALLQELGFVDLEFTVLGRKNGQCRELEILGIRPQ